MPVLRQSSSDYTSFVKAAATYTPSGAPAKSAPSTAAASLGARVKASQIGALVSPTTAVVSINGVTPPSKKEAIASGPPFLPTQITGCQLWLDAADVSKLTLSGSTVTTWGDKSGKGFDCPVAISAVGPTYNSATKALEFRRENSAALAIPQPFTAAISSTTFTSIIVGQRAAAGAVGAFISGGPIGRSYIAMHVQDSRMYLASWDLELGSPIPAYTSPDPRRIYEYDIQSTTSAILSMNGTAVGSNSVNFTHPAFGYHELGRSFGQDIYNRYHHTINVSEILIFAPSLTTVQRQKVEGYLAWKWNLQSDLPVAHPHKSSAPSA